MPGRRATAAGCLRPFRKPEEFLEEVRWKVTPNTRVQGPGRWNGEVGRRPWLRNAPELEVIQRAAVARGEVAGVDGLASEALVARGEAADQDGLVSVVRMGGGAQAP